jgi:hypothetical protein
MFIPLRMRSNNCITQFPNFSKKARGHFSKPLEPKVADKGGFLKSK